MRASEAEYRALELRAHALLEDAPLHDVWRLDLPGGTPNRTILDLRALLARKPITQANPVVARLFGLRRALGRVFGWDDDEAGPSGPATDSYLHRLSEADRAASLVEPGSPDPPFRALYVTEREAISEVRNATVHAFSVFALSSHGAGHRLYVAIHVRPVGRITGAYMALIDPFRRFIVYPALLRHIEREWSREAYDPG